MGIPHGTPGWFLLKTKGKPLLGMNWRCSRDVMKLGNSTSWEEGGV